MDRASDSGSEGWGFESLPAYQKIQTPFGVWIFCCRWDSNHLNPTVRWTVGGAGRAVPAANFARWLSTTRHFPDPPGIGGESPLTMRTIAFYDSSLPCPARYRYCGGSGCTGQSPPCQRGVGLAEPNRGDSKAGRFPHWLVLLESACCESLSRLRRQLPLTREPFCVRYCSIVRYRAFSCFQSTAWNRNLNKIYIPKRG